jgi:hypothetical protein
LHLQHLPLSQKKFRLLLDLGCFLRWRKLTIVPLRHLAIRFTCWRAIMKVPATGTAKFIRFTGSFNIGTLLHRKIWKIMKTLLHMAQAHGTGANGMASFSPNDTAFLQHPIRWSPTGGVGEAVAFQRRQRIIRLLYSSRCPGTPSCPRYAW